MLALFPFEVDFYRKHQVPVTYVGHPVADEIERVSVATAKATLNLDNEIHQHPSLLPWF